MHVTFAPKDILQIDDARIVYRNFSGEESKFNRKGDRNFAIVIPDEDIKDALIERGWNVKIKPPREEGDVPFMVMPVKIKFNDYGPRVYLKTGNKLNELNEDTVDILDNIEFEQVDLDIRPYDWEVNNKTGRTAYLQAIKVVQKIDRFASDLSMDEYPEE